MIFLKNCPKCRGDMVLDRDMYGDYIKCLQCGLINDALDRDEVRAGSPKLDEDLAAA